ncbi:MAG: A/G-specific adenine glycosylase [Desulfobacteraceae bacterium]|nr:A/G-specific adenine glycosylase [Desulfobacteraceae bacterium]
MTPINKKHSAFTRAERVKIRQDLMHWYHTHHRSLPWRENSDPYRIWVSEVMLQQTRVKTAVPYFLAFVDAFPTFEDLAKADLEQVLKLWEGLGYYARARNLHKAACRVVSDLDGRIPAGFADFKALPGVGEYIASAVLSMAFGQAHAVVDANVKRVLARLLCLDVPVNLSSAHKQFQTIADSLLDRNDPGGFNQAVMELGALVCTPTVPTCSICPLADHCCALSVGQVHTFPLRLKAKKIPCHRISTGIVIKNGKLLVTRRKLSGLLGGLWEFPGGKRLKGETARTACIREIKEETGLDVSISSFLTRVKHAYTHFKIEMDVFYCDYVSGEVILNGPIDYQWITPMEISRLAFPKANLKFIPLIYQELVSGKVP